MNTERLINAAKSHYMGSARSSGQTGAFCCHAHGAGVDEALTAVENSSVVVKQPHACSFSRTGCGGDL